VLFVQEGPEVLIRGSSTLVVVLTNPEFEEVEGAEDCVVKGVEVIVAVTAAGTIVALVINGIVVFVPIIVVFVPVIVGIVVLVISGVVVLVSDGIVVACVVVVVSGGIVVVAGGIGVVLGGNGVVGTDGGVWRGRRTCGGSGTNTKDA